MKEKELHNKVIAITGAGGALGSALANGLAKSGAKIALLGRAQDKMEPVQEVIEAMGGGAQCFYCDVLDREQVAEAFRQAVLRFERIDTLINMAGGNRAGATVQPQEDFFELDTEDLRAVVDLNLHGTIFPCMEMSKVMIGQKKGSIINISSMAAQKPLTRVVGYSAAKAAISNFTRWLAVELARKHGEQIRVNAIAPGFFLGEQNRSLLLHEDGTPTDRARTIIEHTPMGRFGKPEELIGVTRWLCGDEAAFVTGAVIPVDGGFGAWSGV